MQNKWIQNPWIKLLICYFTGIFGVHKFIEKKIGIGILYLCTFGLFGIGWIVDVIKYLIVAIKNTCFFFVIYFLILVLHFCNCVRGECRS